MLGEGSKGKGGREGWREEIREGKSEGWSEGRREGVRETNLEIRPLNSAVSRV